MERDWKHVGWKMDLIKLIVARSDTWKGYLPERSKNICSQTTCKSMFSVALFTVAQNWEQPECPSPGKWINKLWYLHLMEYNSAIKSNELLINGTIKLNLKNTLNEEARQKERKTVWLHWYETEGQELNHWWETLGQWLSMRVEMGTDCKRHEGTFQLTAIF